MRVLVVGLGSMGRRRVRNLHALGITAVAGFDVRADRREEASHLYGIPTFNDFRSALLIYQPDVLVISTSPESHMDYAWAAADLGISCFIEASVVEADRIRGLAKKIDGSAVVMAPSCTMRYFPGPTVVKSILDSGRIGKVLSLNYHTGQYLPDWHPWEKIEDYYVSKRETGGAREIVAFELTWLNALFGTPTAIACAKGKLTDINADIDDVYHCLLRYPPKIMANFTIEVVSRPHATRELRILGSEGTIVMSGGEGCVRVSTLHDAAWQYIPFVPGTVEPGYINPEEPYIAELADFIAAVKEPGVKRFPNTLEEDCQVLTILYALEQLSRSHR